MDLMRDFMNCLTLEGLVHTVPMRVRSQMREMRRRSKPVVHSVDARHGDARKLFLRDVLQATDVDTVHLSNGGLRSHAKGTDPALPAEVVQVLARVEPVLGKLGFARQQAKVLWRGHRRPKPRTAAYGAVAAIRVLREVELGFELDGSAMATAAVRLEHR